MYNFIEYGKINFYSPKKLSKKNEFKSLHKEFLLIL